MSTFVRIEGRFRALTVAGGRINEDAVQDVVVQLVRDATYGTFADLPQRLKDRMTGPEESFARGTTLEREGESDFFKFVMEFSESLFPIERGGVQHLVGVLAGDLFSLTSDKYKIDSLGVNSVSFPALDGILLRKATENRIKSIRAAFRLGRYEALLAFSIKPRVGLAAAELREVVTSVLDKGFHIAELDTRSIVRSSAHLHELVQIVRVAENARRGHVARFSVNVTAPAHLVREYATAVAQGAAAPVVLKVDGGLDGFSGCQTVRETLPDAFITCYPLLREFFSAETNRRLQPEFFNDALVASGADILYPGGRPNVPGRGGRQLGAGDRDAIIRGVRRYRAIVTRGAYMPTVAGGIHVGQLHAYYTLLGPDVAYFLGGAVAVHKDGPAAGAHLCKRVLSRAAELQESAGMTVPKNLEPKLIREVEESSGDVQAPYLSPQSVVANLPAMTLWFQEP